jgi:flagellar basal-body rod modification protein FlgD
MFMTTVAAPTTTPPSAPAASNTTPQTGNGTIDSTQFLSMLTTELQDQDPLNPTDPSQFTSQLMGYESLDQQIATNTKLDTISTTMSSLLTQVSMLVSPTSNS